MKTDPRYYKRKPRPEDRPSNELLHRYYDYQEATGHLIYRVNAGTRGKRGNRAGTRNKCTGYRAINFEGIIYQEHQLIWAFVHDYWPPRHMHIDHINHIRDDNRLENLRCVPQALNYQNTSPRENKSGHRGVIWSTRKQKWRAYITVTGKRTWLGMFKDKSDAVLARAKAESELGFHPNHGKAVVDIT